MRIEFEQLIKIAGKPCFLVADEFKPSASGSASDIQLEAADVNQPALYVHAPDVERCRAANPGARVHGIWQVLLYSKVVSPNVPLYVIKLTDNSGLYLYNDGGRPQRSGRYTAKLPGYVNGSIETATVVDLDRDYTLRLPPRFAVTQQELAREIKRRQTNMVLGMVISFILGIGTVIGADYSLGLLSEARQEKLNNINAQIQTQQSLLNSLRATRFTDQLNTDMQTIELQRLLYLAHNSRALKLQERDLTTGNWSVVSYSPIRTPPWEASVTPQPINNLYEITWGAAQAPGGSTTTASAPAGAGWGRFSK